MMDKTHATHDAILTGLARECPSCRVVAHYEVKTRRTALVECPLCLNEFFVQKYKRGERPKPRKGTVL